MPQITTICLFVTTAPCLFTIPSRDRDFKDTLLPSIHMVHWHLMHILLVPDPPAKYWAWLSGSILCVYDCNPGINGPASWLHLTRIYGAWDATWYQIWQRIRKSQSELGMVKPSKVWDEITTTSQTSMDAQLKF